LGHPRAPSLEAAVFECIITAAKAGAFCQTIVGNRSRSAKRKKPETGWNASEVRKTLVFVALHGIPVQK
jgi:hypothetical protein